MSGLSLFLFFLFSFSLMACIGLFISFVVQKFLPTYSPTQMLRLQYALLLMPFIGLASGSLFPEETFEQPISQKFREIAIETRVSLDSMAHEVPEMVTTASAISLFTLTYLFLLACGLHFLKLIVGTIQTLRRSQQGSLYKKSGRLQIRFLPDMDVPLSLIHI